MTTEITVTNQGRSPYTVVVAVVDKASEGPDATAETATLAPGASVKRYIHSTRYLVVTESPLPPAITTAGVKTP